MAEQIQCPHCGQTYELTPQQVPQYAGQTINCTNCQRAFTVPREVGAGGAGGAFTSSQAPPPQPPFPPPGAAPQQPIGYGGYAAPQQQSNGLAIASLVFGILGLFIPIVPGIVAIILGVLGIGKTKDPRVGGKGLAIAGICVGGASLVLTGCMISILLPSLNRARETANRVKCASNLRQIGQAQLLYANENRGQLSVDFPGILTTQDITAEVFVCPSSNDTAAPAGAPQQQAQVLHQHCSYVYIPGLTNAASADTVVAYEPLANHDGDGANFLWGDGHVSWESKQTATAMIKALEAGQNPPVINPSQRQGAGQSLP